MKIRTGFVSNSSTSSFIVQTKMDYFDKIMKTKEEPLSEEKVKLLKECGFVPIGVDDPFLISRSKDKLKKFKTKDDTYLGYWIICNQTFVLQFLVANNIPFKASIHYDHDLYSYDKDDDYIYILHNYGIAHLSRPKEGYEDKGEWSGIEQEPYTKIKKKEFLEEYDEKECLEIIKDDILTEGD